MFSLRIPTVSNEDSNKPEPPIDIEKRRFKVFLSVREGLRDEHGKAPSYSQWLKTTNQPELDYS